LRQVGGGEREYQGDRFRDRNKLRYPVLRSAVTEVKVTWLAEVARGGALNIEPYDVDIQGFLAKFPTPPAIEVVAVSVDTPEGRRDATDVLARTTLNAGVAGMQLHVARHGFTDGACAYCQYVDEQPTLSGSQMLAEMIGLSVERVIAARAVENSRALSNEPPSSRTLSTWPPMKPMSTRRTAISEPAPRSRSGRCRWSAGGRRRRGCPGSQPVPRSRSTRPQPR